MLKKLAVSVGVFAALVGIIETGARVIEHRSANFHQDGRPPLSVEQRQLAIYLRAQRNVIALFPRANVVMSTQPVMYDNAITTAYRKALAPAAGDEDAAARVRDDDQYMKLHAGDACGTSVAPQALGYFLGNDDHRH